MLSALADALPSVHLATTPTGPNYGSLFLVDVTTGADTQLSAAKESVQSSPFAPTFYWYLFIISQTCKEKY